MFFCLGLEKKRKMFQSYLLMIALTLLILTHLICGSFKIMMVNEIICPTIARSENIQLFVDVVFVVSLSNFRESSLFKIRCVQLILFGVYYFHFVSFVLVGLRNICFDDGYKVFFWCWTEFMPIIFCCFLEQLQIMVNQ